MNGYKTLQSHSNNEEVYSIISQFRNRIKSGWWQITYNGVLLDNSTACEVKYLGVNYVAEEIK